MMKNTRLIAILLTMSAFSLLSCEKVEDGEFVEPITLYEKVAGSWTLNDILQIDETAKVAGITPDEISLFNQFGFENLQITLDVDTRNQPAAYQVTGNAPELFPHEGFWDLNNSFPSASGKAPTINLYSDASKVYLTAQLAIVSMPGATTEMELRLTRISAGVPFVSYHYKLSTTN